MTAEATRIATKAGTCRKDKQYLYLFLGQFVGILKIIAMS